MKILFFLFITIIELFAFDCNSTEVSINSDISIAYRTQSTYFGGEDDFSSRASINNRLDIKFYNVNINSDMDIFSVSNPNSNLRNISNNYGEKLDKTYQINSLNLSLDLNDNISLYHGAIPFRGGRFAEIKDPTVNGGNGLPILQNQSYISDFVSIHNDDTSFKIGKGTYHEKLHYHGVLPENEDSDGIFALLTYEDGKHFFEANYFDMNILIKGNDFAKVKLGGVGYIFDDSLESGLTFYTNLGFDTVSEKVSTLTPDFAKDLLRNQGYQVDDYSSHGYAGLIGLNYEFDKNNITYNIGIEEFFTRGEWISANYGNQFLSDYSFLANKQSLQTSIYGGVNFTKNFRVSSKITHSESKKVPDLYSFGKTTTQQESPLGDYLVDKFTKVEFLINYIF